MTQRTDRERLDAIQQKVDAGCCGAMYLDVQFLLARLAALEHERETVQAMYDALSAKAFENSDVLLQRAAHAEAALLNLQRERDELQAELTGTLSEAFQAVPVCYDTPADHYREMARRLVEDRDVQKHRARHAEAALLSLQTAIRELITEWSVALKQDSKIALMLDSPYHRGTCHARQNDSQELAALLPDPAGKV